MVVYGGMRLLFRLSIFALVFIFYLGTALPVPTMGVEFMQVETKADAVKNQQTDSLFSYDKNAINALTECKYDRFSIKTTAGEEVIQSLRGKLRLQEEVENITVEYYFSPLLEEYVVVNGEKINLQVSEKNGVWTIGYPMIDIGF